jgi:hypothetical protein
MSIPAPVKDAEKHDELQRKARELLARVCRVVNDANHDESHED